MTTTTTRTYPTSGPSLKVTSLPAECPAMLEWAEDSVLLSRLHMAVDTLVADDAYPALRGARCVEEATVICRDDEHLEEVEAELSDIGAEWERLGVGRRVMAHDGNYWVEA